MPGKRRTRNGRRGNDPKNASQQRQSAGSRDGNSTPHANTGSSQQSRKGAGAGAKSGSNNVSRSTDNNGQNGSTAQGQTTTTSLPSSEEQYTPTAGFNYDAVDAALKQGYDLRAPLYKPEPNVAQPARPETPWGLKPGSMANGKDFWLDLRKQVAALQQTGGTSQGG
ncbi:hypothetical protein ABEF95_016998 [Exophiala dermatitidis]